ncbi:protein DEPP1 [Erinaceus europaeus]|uniref:Protein DEPP1 n=1 Tax=Erinaceus europaeus TaxID=9365 RepID=A0A1S2ZBL3_ERIEU|nr:protein DEPP1 [Erinaceus europaeus]
MRSRLLLSVPHLPTIREASEEILPGSGQEPPASPSLDDYVKSICHLAQPTSILEEGATMTGSKRAQWPARSCEKSCPTASLRDISTCLNCQQRDLLGVSTGDPLDWLFGASQEKQTSQRDTLKTGPSAHPWGLFRKMDSRKVQGTPKGKLSDGRVPRNSLESPSRNWNQDSKAFKQPGRAAASHSSNSHPNSILRTLYLHLPVIYEL